MSKADRKLRMCEVKTPFHTQAAAHYHINMQPKPSQWKTYECPHCHCWHIAHAIQAKNINHQAASKGSGK